MNLLSRVLIELVGFIFFLGCIVFQKRSPLLHEHNTTVLDSLLQCLLVTYLHIYDPCECSLNTGDSAMYMVQVDALVFFLYNRTERQHTVK